MSVASKFNCEECGEFRWPDGNHACAPMFDVGGYIDEMDYTCRGSDALQAAQKHAELHFADYDYPKELELFLRPHGTNDAPKKYVVTIEMHPHFSAREGT